LTEKYPEPENQIYFRQYRENGPLTLCVSLNDHYKNLSVQLVGAEDIGAIAREIFKERNLKIFNSDAKMAVFYSRQFIVTLPRLNPADIEIHTGLPECIEIRDENREEYMRFIDSIEKLMEKKAKLHRMPYSVPPQTTLDLLKNVK